MASADDRRIYEGYCRMRAAAIGDLKRINETRKELSRRIELLDKFLGEYHQYTRKRGVSIDPTPLDRAWLSVTKYYKGALSVLKQAEKELNLRGKNETKNT